MADEYTARKQEGWRVICKLPDVCDTPMGSSMMPTPYLVYAELKDAVQTVSTVRANGFELVALNKSYLPKTIGDTPGTGTNLKSGTVEGKCIPKEHSKTVRVGKGHHILRHGDEFFMNCP